MKTISMDFVFISNNCKDWIHHEHWTWNQINENERMNFTFASSLVRMRILEHSLPRGWPINIEMHALLCPNETWCSADYQYNNTFTKVLDASRWFWDGKIKDMGHNLNDRTDKISNNSAEAAGRNPTVRYYYLPQIRIYHLETSGIEKKT